MLSSGTVVPFWLEMSLCFHSVENNIVLNINLMCRQDYTHAAFPESILKSQRQGLLNVTGLCALNGNDAWPSWWEDAELLCESCSPSGHSRP